MMLWTAPHAASECHDVVALSDHMKGEPSMGDVITIGVDLAKSVFQVHGVDAAGSVVVRRQLRRRQVLPFFERLRPCLVGMEACATAQQMRG